MVKEKLEPINVASNLKTFLEYKKSKIKIQTKQFHSISKILLDFLSSNEQFISEYLEYCNDNGIECDISSNSAENVMKYFGDDNLSILTTK